MQQWMIAYVTILVHMASCYHIYLLLYMHLIQYQCDVISFAGYYVIACCTLTASIAIFIG